MKLSIVTINYNNVEGLRRTYNSVMFQSCQDFEWIIIDGGSTDGSKEFIEEHQFCLTFWCSESDKGVYHAMNKGVTHCSGEYIQFINSGDELYDSDVVKNVMSHLGYYDIIAGDNWSISSDGVASFNAQPEQLTIDDLYYGSLCHPASYIRAKLLVEYPYREDLKIVSDWDFFLRQIVFNGKTYKHISCNVSKFHEDGISQDKEMTNRERQSVINGCFPEILKEAIYGGTLLYKSLRKEPESSASYKILLFVYRFLLTVRSFIGHDR